MDPVVKTIARVGRSMWMYSGLAFVGVALLIAILFLTIWPGPVAIDAIAVFVGVPLVLGAIFMCVRVGVILDRQRRTFSTWWGLLVPFYKSEHPLPQFDYVTVSFRTRAEFNQYSIRYRVYPVRLEGPGANATTIHEPGDHDKASLLAEDVAKFLHLGILDRSLGWEVVREASTLELSLRDRLRRAGQSVPLPAQPPRARAILSYGGIRSPTTIEIPPMPVGTCARWFLIGMLVAGAIAIVLEWWASRRWDVAFGVPSLIMLLLMLVILLPVLIRAAILRERLVVSPHEIVVTRRDIFGTKTTRLAGAEVEDVALVHAKGIGRFTSRVAIQSDRGSIELVAVLANPEEVRWLRDVLVHVLTVTFE